MDEFEKRLKRDADAILAEASPELRARIHASLQSTSQVRPAGKKSGARAGQPVVGQQPDRTGGSHHGYRSC